MEGFRTLKVGPWELFYLGIGTRLIGRTHWAET